MTQGQVLGHSNIYRLERGVEASKRKPGECDVMDPGRGGFLRREQLVGSNVAENLSQIRIEKCPLTMEHKGCGGV